MVSDDNIVPVNVTRCSRRAGKNHITRPSGVNQRYSNRAAAAPKGVAEVEERRRERRNVFVTTHRLFVYKTKVLDFHFFYVYYLFIHTSLYKSSTYPVHIRVLHVILLVFRL